MKPKFARLVCRTLFVSTASALIFFSGTASAANVTWDIAPGTVGPGDSAITGGAGTWDVTNGNWTLDAGANNLAWVNANNDTAIFGGSVGTVTLGAPITANGLTFNVSGYTIAGTSPNILTLAGTTPTVTVTNSGESAIISAIIAGTAGLTKAGAGTLTLSGTNTYTGDTTISSGTLEFSGNALTPGAAAVFKSSGTALFTGINDGSPTTASSYSLGGVNTGFSGTFNANNARLIVDNVNDVGSASLVNTGFGQLYFTVAGPFTNNLTIQGNGWGEPGGNFGAIRLQNATTLSGIVTLANDARITTHGSTGTISGNIVETGGARTLDVGGSNSTTSLTLSGTNSYSGGTIVNGSISAATLALNFATNDTNKLGDTGTLNFRGTSTITLTGGTITDSVGATSLNAGTAATITRISGGVKLGLGAITRGVGSTLNLSADSIATTTNSPVGGNLGPWLTVNNTALATTNGLGEIIAVTYTDVPTVTGNIANGSNQVRITTTTAGNVTTDAGTVDVNSITRTEAGLATISMAGNTLRLAQQGAVLSGTGSGGITFGTAANSGTLTAGGAADTAGSLEFNVVAGIVTVNSTITNNGSGTISVEKLGGGELILAGTNTFSGGFTFSGGIVRASTNNSALGTAGVVVNRSTTLATANGGGARTLTNTFSVAANTTLSLDSGYFSLTLNSPISGAGNLASASSGTSIFGAANTYTGTTTVGTAAAAFQINSGASIIGTSSVTVANGGNSTLTNFGTITTPGAFTLNGGSTATQTPVTNGNVAGTTPGTINAASMTLGAGTSAVTASRGGAYTQNTGSSTAITGAITVTGSSSVNNPSTSQGSTFINNGGTVTAASLTLVQSAAGSTISNIGGTYTQSAGSTTITNNITLSATGTGIAIGASGNDAALNLSGGSISAGSAGLNGTTTVSGTGILNVAGTFYMGEAAAGRNSLFNQTGGTVNINTTTSDTIRIGHWGTETSTYNLSGGILNVTGVDAVLGWDGAGVLNISNGTANFRGLRLGNTQSNGNHNGANTLSLTGGTLNLGLGGMGSGGTGTKTVSFGAANIGAFANWTGSAAAALTSTTPGTTFNTLDSVDGITARSVTISGVLSGVGSLVKINAGGMSISGTNTYSGTTTVNGGTLSVTGTGSVRSSSAFNIGTGATFRLASTNVFLTGHGSAMDNARVITADGGNFLCDSGESRLGNVTLKNGSTWTINRTLASFDYLLANTTTGAATVTVANTGGNMSPSVMSGSSTTGLHLQGVQNFDVADVTGSSTTDLSVTMTLAGPGSTGGAVGGINKLGAGTMDLTQGNTYTGTTTVSAGTLLANNSSGSATGTGAVTVNSAAKLGGSGTASGAVTIASGGTIAPGNSVGTLNTGALILTGTYACEVNGATADKIAVTGNLDLTGGTLAITSSSPSGTLVIASYTGTLTGTFGTVTGLPPGYALNYNAGAKQIELVPSDAYSSWATTAGLTGGNNGKADNPDGDGLNNLGEFAFNDNPLSGVSSGKIASKIATIGADQVMTLTLPARSTASFSPSGTTMTATADTVTYVVEGSDTLSTFAIAVTEVTGPDATAIQASLGLPLLDSGWTYHTFRLTPTVASAPKGFIRAKVSSP
ncbi:autotransporter-associated beta strand repeat-containing protein [Luteolibacter ambystomatis]|uniref:Autotransporter-associated beta strand repeat-containing protein n=1 Tax=Luteolibacter ambystomatis TaxID=2824561 RepID=A0A975G8T8_9BACT|nr:autotransporter-associated beta strand repeat-containing protein [Luteolibacter ambystomatis]QUE51462.1 autotransporter-associated beta strand repeat-containing protein [Luteolibacter ambystomatis]